MAKLRFPTAKELSVAGLTLGVLSVLEYLRRRALSPPSHVANETEEKSRTGHVGTPIQASALEVQLEGENMRLSSPSAGVLKEPNEEMTAPSGTDTAEPTPPKAAHEDAKPTHIAPSDLNVEVAQVEMDEAEEGAEGEIEVRNGETEDNEAGVALRGTMVVEEVKEQSKEEEESPLEEEKEEEEKEEEEHCPNQTEEPLEEKAKLSEEKEGLKEENKAAQHEQEQPEKAEHHEEEEEETEDQELEKAEHHEEEKEETEDEEPEKADHHEEEEEETEDEEPEKAEHHEEEKEEEEEPCQEQPEKAEQTKKEETKICEEEQTKEEEARLEKKEQPKKKEETEEVEETKHESSESFAKSSELFRKRSMEERCALLQEQASEVKQPDPVVEPPLAKVASLMMRATSEQDMSRPEPPSPEQTHQSVPSRTRTFAKPKRGIMGPLLKQKRSSRNWLKRSVTKNWQKRFFRLTPNLNVSWVAQKGAPTHHVEKVSMLLHPAGCRKELKRREMGAAVGESLMEQKMALMSDEMVRICSTKGPLGFSLVLSDGKGQRCMTVRAADSVAKDQWVKYVEHALLAHWEGLQLKKERGSKKREED